MTGFETIVVVHPGAIGDVVLGTPVAARLRQNYPESRIIYLTHASLFPLLELCPAINDVVAWNKRVSGTPGYVAFFNQLRQLRGLNPDLVVDLTGSFRTRSLSLLSGARSIFFKKQPKSERPIMHVADNYLAVLDSLKLRPEDKRFPTLTVPSEILFAVKNKLGRADHVIAIVPGVGRHRPHRAWPVDQWIGLAKAIYERFHCTVVIVGGTDDQALAQQIAAALGERCINFASRLSLPETAALLKTCRAVVSADTGPSHIAVAVGTAVIGLTGPTWPQRSGPYGMEQLGLNACDQCRCMSAKRCLLNDGAGPGECMRQIAIEQVMEKLESALNTFSVTGTL